MGDLLEITIAVRSKVHSAFHPFVVGKMSASTGDKLCCVCNGIGVAPTPAVSCGRRRKLQYNAMNLDLGRPLVFVLFVVQNRASTDGGLEMIVTTFREPLFISLGHSFEIFPWDACVTGVRRCLEP